MAGLVVRVLGLIWQEHERLPVATFDQQSGERPWSVFPLPARVAGGDRERMGFRMQSGEAPIRYQFGTAIEAYLSRLFQAQFEDS